MLPYSQVPPRSRKAKAAPRRSNDPRLGSSTTDDGRVAAIGPSPAGSPRLYASRPCVTAILVRDTTLATATSKARSNPVRELGWGVGEAQAAPMSDGRPGWLPFIVRRCSQRAKPGEVAIRFRFGEVNLRIVWRPAEHCYVLSAASAAPSIAAILALKTRFLPLIVLFIVADDWSRIRVRPERVGSVVSPHVAGGSKIRDATTVFPCRQGKTIGQGARD